MAKKYYDDMGSDKKANPGAPGGVYSDANAGMPEEKVMKDYPKGNYNSGGNYNDTLQGIDMFAKNNHMKVEKQKRGLGDS